MTQAEIHELHNPGMMPFGMTIDDFKAGVSRIRNPVIARVFRELDLMEEWGSGYRRIQDDCHAGAYPVPEWQELASVVRVEFRPHTERVRDGAHSTDRTAQSGAQSATQSGAQSGAQSKRVLMALKALQLSASELAATMQLDSKTGAFKRTIKELLEQALIAYTIPDKPGSRLQKHHFTGKGRSHLKRLESE